MGMYSYFREEDIKVIDMNGLNSFMKQWAKLFPNSWINSKEYKMLNVKDNAFTFEKWDNIKIISYWYDEVLIFLTCVAKYIEGEVFWNFESDDESGWVEFSEGKAIIHSGQMNWNEWKANEGVRIFNKGNNYTSPIFEETEEVIQKYKDLMFLNEI